MSVDVARTSGVHAGARHGVRPLGRTVGWRPALLVARRDLLAHRGRSALAVVMLGLPIGLAAAVAVLAASSDITVEESLPGRVGSSAGLVMDGLVDGPVTQDSTGERLYGGDDAEQPLRASLSTDQVQALLPGTRLVPTVTASVVLVAPDGDPSDPADQEFVRAVELDTREPVTTGMYVVLAGRLPRAPGEVAFSPGAVRAAGAAVGDPAPLYASGPDGVLSTTRLDLEVVGIAAPQGEDPTVPVVVSLPGGLAVDGSVGPGTWLVESGRALGGQELAVLNAAGLTLLSPAVVAAPPAGVPAPPPDSSRVETAVYVVGVVLVVLQVVLLAAPSFAVSVRRQRADFALLGATGADGRALRRVVLVAAGLVGGVAAITGLVVGIGGTALALVLGYPWLPVSRGPVELPVPALAVVLALGLGAGILAAWFPARSVARADIAAGLAGRRGVTRTPWRLAGAGVAVTAAGAGATWVGGSGDGDAVVLAVGVLLSTVGVLLLVPLLVAGLEPLAGGLPLALRLAARDASRSAGRSIAAVSAVAAVAGGVMTFGTYASSELQFSRDTYRPQFVEGLSTVQYDTTALPDAATAVAALKPLLPAGSEVTTLAGLGSDADGTVRRPFLPAPGCDDPAATEPGRSAACGARQAILQGAVVADEQTLATVGVELDADERDLLRGGGLLLFPEVAAVLGTDTLTAVPVAEAQDPRPPYATTVTAGEPVQVPVLAYDGDRPPGLSNGTATTALLLPATAERLGGSSPRTAVVSGAGPLTEEDQQRLEDEVLVLSVYTERGYQPNYFGRGLLVVGLAVIAVLGLAVGTLTATGLALVDARPVRRVLSDVGARASTQRAVAGATAFVVAVCGGVAGVVMGIGPGVALARLSTGSYYDPTLVAVDSDGYLAGATVQVDPTVVLAWPAVLGLVVVVPVVLGLLVAACTRGDRRPAR